MANPVPVIERIISDQRVTIAGVSASLIVWWYFIGRKKYSAGKGVKRYV